MGILTALNDSLTHFNRPINWTSPFLFNELLGDNFYNFIQILEEKSVT